MKQLVIFFVVFFNTLLLHSQNTTLIITANSEIETAVIDSIGYTKKHNNFNSIRETLTSLDNKLNSLGYLYTEKEQIKNDSISYISFKYKLNKPIKKAKIDISSIDTKTKKILELESDTLIIPFKQIQNLLLSLTERLEQNGYGTSSIYLDQHKINNFDFEAKLQVKLNKKRKLDDFEIITETKAPRQLIKNTLKHYKNKAFNNSLIDEIHSELELLPFVKQNKSPEILFTTDSTKVYLFLDRFNSNKFDGLIGFNNSDGEVKFNGYLNLNLLNILNYGEEFLLMWKKDGNSQTFFNLSSEIPYILKTPLAIKGNIEIFKQDSTYQNTNLNINAGYLFSYFSKIYIGYKTTTSAAKENSTQIQNFNNRFITTNYEYKRRKPEDLLFNDKTKLSILIGTGNRKLESIDNKQTYLEINAFNNFILNNKNSIFVQLHLYSIFSHTYISNELKRFGGNNSIRGFQDNSLQGNFFTTISTEYRFKLSPTLYVNSILDYGNMQDKTTSTKESLYSFGLGFGILTKNGRLNLIYANGNTKNTPIQLKNSMVHINFSMGF